MLEQQPADWKRAYREALTEPDRAKLAAKIAAAESVLFSRLQEMHHERTHGDEAIAICDAIHALRLLQCDLYSVKKRDEISSMFKQ